MGSVKTSPFRTIRNLFYIGVIAAVVVVSFPLWSEYVVDTDWDDESDEVTIVAESSERFVIASAEIFSNIRGTLLSITPRESVEPFVRTVPIQRHENVTVWVRAQITVEQDRKGFAGCKILLNGDEVQKLKDEVSRHEPDRRADILCKETLVM